MKQNRPRIAFCFSGQARTLDQTYQLFQKNLFDASKEQGFEYDVFCAVEDDEDVDKINLLNPTKTEKIKSSEVGRIIEERYGNFIRNEYIEKYGLSGNKGSVNMLQQFYKISRSIKIKEDYELKNNIKYDIVFKLRFDTPFARKLNFKEIYHAIKSGNNIVLCNKNKLIPSLKFITIIEDFYFITNNKSCEILGKIFDNWKECFIGHEIKFKKLYKFFEKIIIFLDSSYVGDILSLPIYYIYSLFFMPFCPERNRLNYFKFNSCKLDSNNYITVWLIRDERRYKKLDFRSHSKKWMFKKGKYEL